MLLAYSHWYGNHIVYVYKEYPYWIFRLLIRNVIDIIPWMFSFDHINYSRWLPLFLHNVKYIPHTLVEAFNQLANEALQ